MNDLIVKEKQKLIKRMPKKYSQFTKLNKFGTELFKEEKLIEIQLNNKVYTGKCFINTDKRDMYWQPQHRHYIYINELETSISYNLLKDKGIRIIPTEIQLNTFKENKVKSIIKKGKFHLKETQKAYLDLKEINTQGNGD